tara:strand:- start:2599 stop:3000 length:402 start_codon:yes stop_codon:yes gene_type:complete
MNNDIIFQILTFLIKPNECIKNVDINLFLISKTINRYFKFDNCNQFVKYNNKFWCKYHNYHEFRLSRIICSKIEYTYEVDYDLNSDITTYHLNDDEYKNNDLQKIYDNVTQNDNVCIFSHCCCGGKGIVFSII